MNETTKKYYTINFTSEDSPLAYTLFDDGEWYEWSSGGNWKRFSSEKEAEEELEKIKGKNDNPFLTYFVSEYDL